MRIRLLPFAAALLTTTALHGAGFRYDTSRASPPQEYESAHPAEPFCVFRGFRG